jgi:signal transduction histidine kinase
MVYTVKVDIVVFSVIIMVELFYRISFFIAEKIDFITGLILNMLIVITIYATYGYTLPIYFHFRFAVLFFMIFSVSIKSWFIVKNNKYKFYHNFIQKKNYQWFKNVIDHMNSGFLSLKNREFKYMNRQMYHILNIFDKSDFENNSDDDDFLCNLQISNSYDIKTIFKNIKNDEQVVNNYEEIIEKLSKQINNDFVYLGTKTLISDLEKYTYFEIYGRRYKLNKEDNYEFIFNDITRSKLMEEKNAQLKYKTMFLSKVAHEFKNPLLCIQEIADQLLEDVPTTIPLALNSNRDLLNQIKSMSKFLLILIKDLDFFSKKNNTAIQQKFINNDNIKIENILEFCKDVTHSLLKKFDKENYINFEIIKESVPDYIIGDEVIIVQILINLLSNSVKFTTKGCIELILKYNDELLTFTVQDTGKGITEEQRTNLFKPFTNENDENLSSGLGLYIIKELTTMIGSKIEYESSFTNGTRFWFSIKVDASLNNSLSITYDLYDNETIKLTNDGFDNLKSSIYFKKEQLNEKGTQTEEAQIAIKSTDHVVNIIVVDDELYTRKSTIRVIYKFAKNLGIDVNVIEASDGIECLTNYLNCFRIGMNVAFIISDETMDFLDGSICAETLSNISHKKRLPNMPYFILTAYENFHFDEKNGVKATYTKPLTDTKFDDILSKYNEFHSKNIKNY